MTARSRLQQVIIGALLAGAIPLIARAQAAAAAAPQPGAPSPVPGWDAFVDSLRTLPERMLAKLPEDRRADPQVRQEIGRLALESLASGSLEAIGGDGDAPAFLPTIGGLLNIGQPNADTIYRTALITPGGSYRLRGRRGTLNLAVITQIAAAGGKGARPTLDLANVKTDAAGRYDVLISAARPAGYAGDWWPLDPATNRLMVRMVSSDWAHEIDPTFAIERIDRPPARPRTAAAVLAQRLAALPGTVDTMALLFVDHVAKLRQEGYVNRLKVFDVPVGALQGQFYYEGVYDLADDEALIVTSPVPASCRYRSLILTNELYETTDWVDNHSSLNGAQAAPDADGKLRIVVSARDPGIRNWLDTAGYPTGMIQGRWTGCDTQPIPEVRKVKLADVAAALPPGVATVTPVEREAIVRERRRAYRERPVW